MLLLLLLLVVVVVLEKKKKNSKKNAKKKKKHGQPAQSLLFASFRLLEATNLLVAPKGHRLHATELLENKYEKMVPVTFF